MNAYDKMQACDNCKKSETDSNKSFYIITVVEKFNPQDTSVKPFSFKKRQEFKLCRNCYYSKLGYAIFEIIKGQKRWHTKDNVIHDFCMISQDTCIDCGVDISGQNQVDTGDGKSFTCINCAKIRWPDYFVHPEINLND